MNKSHTVIIFVALVGFSMPAPCGAFFPLIVIGGLAASTILPGVVYQLTTGKRAPFGRRLMEKGHKMDWDSTEELKLADRAIHTYTHDHLTEIEKLLEPSQKEKLAGCTQQQKEDAMADAFERWCETHESQVLEAAEKTAANKLINKVELPFAQDDGDQTPNGVEEKIKSQKALGHNTMGYLAMIAGMCSVLGVTLLIIAYRSSLLQMIWRPADMMDDEEMQMPCD
jgi:hypothetical protein